jgi:flagellar biosynthesis protein FliP
MRSRLASMLLLAILPAASAAGQVAGASPPNGSAPSAPSVIAAPAAATRPASPNMADFAGPQGLSGALNWAAILTVLAVAPAVAILATCFTRVVVVLGLLRQAMTTQQVPPNQVMLGLAFLVTVVAMSPVLGRLHAQAWGPYSAGRLSAEAAVEAGTPVVRGFLIEQVRKAGNDRDVMLFLDPAQRQRADLAWSDVPTPALLAGYVVSELKVAFLIGVRFFLPFVIVDMLVATILTSMGMLMLPPVLISLPLKLLLFVLADGWHLVVGTLMNGLAVT